MPAPDAVSIEKPTEEQLLFKKWLLFNAALLQYQRYGDLVPLLRKAVEAKARPQVIARIYQRLSVLRRKEETAALEQGRMPESI